jgi:hypothetical protein
VGFCDGDVVDAIEVRSDLGVGQREQRTRIAFARCKCAARRVLSAIDRARVCALLGA